MDHGEGRIGKSGDCRGDDKCQITAVFAAPPTGDFLPPQLIYKDKTVQCLSTISFPHDWHIIPIVRTIDQMKEQ